MRRMEPKEKKAFEPTGLVPRSIVRTFERFRQQLLPGSERAAIREYRISRYQVLVSARCLFALLTIPIATNWFVSSWLLSPIIEHYWNTQQNEIFLNSYQEERAFAELEFFSDKLFFESLLSNQNDDFKNPKGYQAESQASVVCHACTKGAKKMQTNLRTPDYAPSLPLWNTQSLLVRAPLHRRCIVPVNVSASQVHRAHSFQPRRFTTSTLFATPVHPGEVNVKKPSHISVCDFALAGLIPFHFESALSQVQVPLLAENIVHDALAKRTRRNYYNKKQSKSNIKNFVKFQVATRTRASEVPVHVSASPVMIACPYGARSRGGEALLASSIHGKLPLAKRSVGVNSDKSESKAFIERTDKFDSCINGVNLINNFSSQNGCRRQTSEGEDLTRQLELNKAISAASGLCPSTLNMQQVQIWKKRQATPTLLCIFDALDRQLNSSVPLSSIYSRDQFMDIWNTNNTENSVKIKERIQKKIVELAVYYNEQTIVSITNIAGDFVSVLTLGFLFIWMKPEISILKSFLIEAIYSLSDTTKSFLLILLTDLLVGFHSPRGWETALELLLKHFGLPENQDFVFLFVATFPVLLDTVFKYWIFRHLNKISPSTVATYHSMIE